MPVLVERSELLGKLPNELGVPVAVPDALLVLDHLGLAFDSFVVHDCGFNARLRIALREPTISGGGRALPDAMFSPPDSPQSHGRFLVGLELSDGRRGYHG